MVPLRFYFCHCGPPKYKWHNSSLVTHLSWIIATLVWLPRVDTVHLSHTLCVPVPKWTIPRLVWSWYVMHNTMFKVLELRAWLKSNLETQRPVGEVFLLRGSLSWGLKVISRQNFGLCDSRIAFNQIEGVMNLEMCTSGKGRWLSYVSVCQLCCSVQTTGHRRINLTVSSFYLLHELAKSHI